MSFEGILRFINRPTEKYILEEKVQYQKEPKSQVLKDEVGNMLDPNKGPRILGKRKEPSLNRVDPDYVYFKDDFEKIAEKATNRRTFYKERFLPIEKAKDLGPYKDKKIWEKWEANKKNSDRKMHLNMFFESREGRRKDHLEIMEEIEAQNEEIQNMRKQILIKKGYEEEGMPKTINYNQTEYRAPSYTIQGRHAIAKNNDEYGVIIGNSDDTEANQLNYPLPNFNYIKPNLPNVIIGTERRFKPIKTDGDSLFKEIFKDGVFLAPERTDFSKKARFSGKDKRSFEKYKSNVPGPNVSMKLSKRGRKLMKLMQLMIKI